MLYIIINTGKLPILDLRLRPSPPHRVAHPPRHGRCRSSRRGAAAAVAAVADTATSRPRGRRGRL